MIVVLNMSHYTPGGRREVRCRAVAGAVQGSKPLLEVIGFNSSIWHHESDATNACSSKGSGGRGLAGEAHIRVHDCMIGSFHQLKELSQKWGFLGVIVKGG